MATKIDDEKLLAAIDAKLVSAYGGDNDTALSRFRQKLIEYYLGLNINPAPEGRSQVVDRSVYETVQTMLPSLVRIFSSSSDEVCKFTPIGPEDEPGAELTTSYINWIVTEKNPWEQILADWIFDALTLPNGYAMAYWEEETSAERETYEGQTDEQVAFLAQDSEVEIIEAKSYDDENYKPQPQPQMDPMTGQPAINPATGQPVMVMPPIPQLHDITVERKSGYGCVHLCTLAPEHCIVDGDTPDWTLQHSGYFEYREEKTIAQLREEGLEVDDDVSDDISLKWTDEDLARDRFNETNNLGHGTSEGIGVMRKVVVRSIWIRCSLDDKDAEFYYAIIVGRTPLYCEPCGRIPVASMVTQPMPHRHPGMCVAETILDQQDIKTAIKRGGLDNLYLANNGRHVISDKVNLEDFLDSRPGGVVRMIDGSLPGQGHVVPLVHPFAFDQIVGAMEYFDQERQNRSGVSRYFSGTDAGSINRTASGISQLTNAAAQRVEHIARMMSPAVEYLFSVVHELVLKHNNKRQMIKLKGKWAPIDPRAWATKRDVKISVGVGAGNKDSLLMGMNNTLSQQIMLAQGPPTYSSLVTPENIFSTLMEIAKLNGFANPQKFYSDPNQAEPQQPPGPPPQMVVEMKKIESDQQKTQAQIASDSQNADQERQLKWAIANLQAQTQEQVVQLKAQFDAASEAMNMQIQVIKAENERLGLHLQMQDQMHQQALSLMPQAKDVQAQVGQQGDAHTQVLGKLTDMVGALHESLNRPKTVVRGPDGKIVGVQ